MRISIAIHGNKVNITEDNNTTFALVASTNAQSIKRRDVDAAADCDKIIDDARPLLSVQARKHVSSAASSTDWQERAAYMKRSMQHYRATR